jgi:hypothetical protein
MEIGIGMSLPLHMTLPPDTVDNAFWNSREIIFAIILEPV